MHETKHYLNLIHHVHKWMSLLLLQKGQIWRHLKKNVQIVKQKEA